MAGAYTELQDVEASEADRDVYARPEGRLLFAGEGAVPADVGAQCTHGAVLSGARAALAALHGMGKKAQLELLGEGPLGLDVEAVVEVMATGRPPGAKRGEREL